jgi:hypothetical protein
MANITGRINLSTPDEAALLAEVNVGRETPFASADAWADWILSQAAGGYLKTRKTKVSKLVADAYEAASPATQATVDAALGVTPPNPAPPQQIKS